MIYTHLTNEAMKLAYQAHHGQVDKGGIPYIFHPYHLAEQMEDEYTTCVALLHDVVEDTEITLEDLAAIFPKEVVEAVALMTHREGEPYLAYVARIKENSIARTVKLADLRHNTNETRLEDASEETLAYYREKYKKAFEIIISCVVSFGVDIKGKLLSRYTFHSVLFVRTLSNARIDSNNTVVEAFNKHHVGIVSQIFKIDSEKHCKKQYRCPEEGKKFLFHIAINVLSAL